MRLVDVVRLRGSSDCCMIGLVAGSLPEEQICDCFLGKGGSGAKAQT